MLFRYRKAQLKKDPNNLATNMMAEQLSKKCQEIKDDNSLACVYVITVALEAVYHTRDTYDKGAIA